MNKNYYFPILLIALFGCGSGNDAEKQKANEQLLQVIQSDKKIKDATITSADVLYVSVVDDGTRRDGYAEYLCQVLKDNQSTVGRVKVIKVNSSKDPNRDNAYGVLLGESYCK